MTESEKHPLEIWMASFTPPLTQKAAAAKLDVSEGYLSLVLSGHRRVSLARAAKWSAITGIPATDFVRNADKLEAAE